MPAAEGIHPSFPNDDKWIPYFCLRNLILQRPSNRKCCYRGGETAPFIGGGEDNCKLVTDIKDGGLI